MHGIQQVNKENVVQDISWKVETIKDGNNRAKQNHLKGITLSGQ